jgi:putative ABC transport system permease protein
MKQCIRNFRRQSTVGILNIFSLSVGVMVFIIIGLWTIDELSFDNFHKNKDRIYRVVTTTKSEKNGYIQMPFGQEAKDEIPAIEDMCRIMIWEHDYRIEGKWITGVRAFVTDPNFFSFFTFELKEGNPNTVFSTPHQIVISESAAEKYFPGINPVGKVINHGMGDAFTISGIMKDMPQNSSLQADFLYPFFGYIAKNDWYGAGNIVTYFLLHKGMNPPDLESSLQKILYRASDEFEKSKVTVGLESLNDLHFSTDVKHDAIISKENKSLILMFVFVAFIILTVSCINFTNLFISTSFIRVKSIGVKKTFGAGMSSLIREFYLETVCYVFIAIALGLYLAVLLTPIFNDFTQSALNIDFSSPQLYCFLAGLLVFATLLAGSFPAVYITRFNIIKALSGNFKGKRISFFQKSLIVFQLTTSIALMIVIIFMQRQVNYMTSHSLGFETENIICIKQTINDNIFRDNLLRQNSITDVTFKASSLTDWIEGAYINKTPSDEPVIVEVCRVGFNYFDFFNMEILLGENPFSPESPEGSNDVVINESLAKLLGFEQPVNQTIYRGDQIFVIKGIVSNAHTRSFHQDVGPQIYFKMPSNWFGVSFCKINGKENMQDALKLTEQEWKTLIYQYAPDYPFDCYFLEDTYNQLYSKEINAGKVLFFAMLITFIISIAGLFAMTYYATQRRVREIALRKIYGASLKDLFLLLNKDFLLWVSIAFIVASLIAYIWIQAWLTNYVVRTSLSIWVFVETGAIAVVITLLTTTYQTWKVATMNPVKTIKSNY